MDFCRFLRRDLRLIFPLLHSSLAGSRLGQYTLGTSDLVVLGFGQNAIVSARADLGNYFYTDPVRTSTFPTFLLFSLPFFNTQ